MIVLSKKIRNMEESATLAMARKSRELKDKGKAIINLSLGEPDFNTPEFIKESAKKAIDDNFSKYTPVPGYKDLLETVSEKFKRDNNLIYDTNQIICSTGAKQSIAQLLMVILDEGDEVILPAPYWVSYYQMIKLAGGIPKVINTDIKNNFKITAKQLNNTITQKTKAFLFSSPCNPTGTVYNEEELTKLSQVFSKNKNIIVISDEIYEHINFKETHFSIGRIKDIKDQVVTVNGLSKGFAMTGWRFGYLGAPKEIAAACIKMQGQITSATCSITQRAAITALSASPKCTYEMRTKFKYRRNLMIKLLSEIEKLKINTPEGAFYIFPDVSGYIGTSYMNYKIKNANDLAMFLLEDCGVATVSGSAFGAKKYLRISYAASESKLTKACALIKSSLNKLQ
ncbi:MAG: aspartate aminotransferase [Flavobacteriales bacterium]|mgnify:CR=1 FL=1|nr:aspartate aminotransferase [Flavobacteriales bacterium]|tara:strand:+ start:31434 stop:32627 length:1194 start_codon:yes stop_codon:yes gene_type:complete